MQSFSLFQLLLKLFTPVLCTVVTCSVSLLDPPLAYTKQGILQGTIAVTDSGTEFQQFLGIQFARVPGRFEIAVPIESWEGVKSAVEYGPSCANPKVVEDEDCLYLNVYAPTTQVNETDKSLFPVMVYIHGGSFQSNSNRYYGPNYLLDEPVVLVVIQYRLGILGFLSTGDEAAPGNLGLKDQVSALKWIQENIEAFGGDQNNVTIFGQSAGGASVTYHLVSEMSKGLFHRAIAQSGTFIAPWALTANPRHYADELGKAMNCPIDDSSALVECLKKAPLSALMDSCMKRSITIKWHADPLAAFGPVVEPKGSETAFLDSSPYERLIAGNVSKVPLLTGFVPEEGVYLWTYYIMYNKQKACDEPGETEFPWLHDMQTKWQEIAPGTFYFDNDLPDNQSAIISAKIRDYYFGEGAEINRSRFYDLSHAYSDRLFINSGMEFMQLYAQHSTVYPYIYTFNKYWGMEFAGNNWEDLIPDQKIEATHAAELDMLFSPLFGNTRNTTEQNELTRNMVKLWVSFARDGRPSEVFGDAGTFPQVDPSLSVQDLQFFRLDSTTEIIGNMFSNRFSFWKDLGLNEHP